MTGMGFGGMNKSMDRTLGRGAARIQAAVINKFRRQIESARAELEKGR